MDMVNYEHLRMGDLATEIGLGPRRTVLDVTRRVIDQAHDLLGRPFDAELDPDGDLFMGDGRRLLYMPPVKKTNGFHSPTHEEFVELPAWISEGGRKRHPMFYPQHYLRVIRSSNYDQKTEGEQWMNAVSGMDETATHPDWSVPTTLGIFTMRQFLFPDGTVRDVQAGSVFEGRVPVRGLKSGRSNNVDRLPADFTLGMIVRNEVLALSDELYTGWSFTLTLAHLLEVFRKVQTPDDRSC